MLYPKSAEKELTQEQFRHPGSEYRGAPFWAWNCRLEKEELLRQLEVLKKMGLGGAHMHVRTGMATPYLSDEHMALIKACVEKCRDEKMLAWLYDEDRWPSGAAGGLLTKDPQYRARHLLLTTKPYGEGQAEAGLDSSARSARSENGTLLACYDVQLDENGCLTGAKRIAATEEAAGRKWYAYQETDLPNPWYNNQTYANTLDPATMQKFVEITYERYLETVGEDFGGVVPAIFTDEPQFSHKSALAFAREEKDVFLPWTDDLPETFRAAYGEELLEHLPELLWELPEGKVSLIRYHYHDHIAERFAQAFADTCGGWCQEHGLMLTGHMMEEPTLKSQTAALGEAMRSYRSFQLPGIDMLCGSREFTTAKQAQSAVHQYGRPGMTSELYGVTGWDFDFRGHKLHGDWQAALGVTVRVQHLAWVSMKGEAKRDYPASINYQSPWWQDYAYVEDHFARLNTALTRGKPVVRVGVIHPVESYWLHWGPAEQTDGIRRQMDERFQSLTDWLVNGGVDFDFLCESLLPSQCPQGGAPLRVGEMAYDAVVVPGCETLRSTTLERLEAFQRAGGRLIFLGDAPRYADAKPDERGKRLYEQSRHTEFSREALLDALEPVRLIDIRDENGVRTDNLLHQLRQDGDGLWLFLAHSREPYNNDVPTRQNIRLTVKGAYHARIYDTLTGDILPANAEIQGNKTVIRATLYDHDSLLLRLDHEPALPRPVAEDAAAVRQVRVPSLVDYVLDEPNVLLLDKAEVALDQSAYRPEEELLRADNALRLELGWPPRMDAVAQPWTVKEEKTEHTVRLRFTVHSEIMVPGARLALEDAELAKLRVNGKSVPTGPEGWYTDKSIGTITLGTLEAGDTVIEVELPFGRRTNIEWCYLLGAFGVRLQGESRTLTALPEKLGFDDVTRQGLPYYGGNITYCIPLTTEAGTLAVCAPHYDGAALRAALDGEPKGYLVYAPYRLTLGEVEKGPHLLELALLGSRQNAFGPVHLADEKEKWIGPNAWRSEGACWTESYRLKRLGIRSRPEVEFRP